MFCPASLSSITAHHVLCSYWVPAYQPPSVPDSCLRASVHAVLSAKENLPLSPSSPPPSLIPSLDQVIYFCRNAGVFFLLQRTYFNWKFYIHSFTHPCGYLIDICLSDQTDP